MSRFLTRQWPLSKKNVWPTWITSIIIKQSHHRSVNWINPNCHKTFLERNHHWFQVRSHSSRGHVFVIWITVKKSHETDPIDNPDEQIPKYSQSHIPRTHQLDHRNSLIPHLRDPFFPNGKCSPQTTEPTLPLLFSSFSFFLAMIRPRITQKSR